VRQPLAPLPPSPVPMFGRKSSPSAKAIEVAAQLLQEADPALHAIRYNLSTS